MSTNMVVSEAVFERNEHGHIVLAFDGIDLTGKQEVDRLEAAGFHVSSLAESCLTNGYYDKNHRLAAGERYRVALMPIRETKRDSDHRTTDALRKRGVNKYGYEKPLAGIVSRIREAVSDKRMKEMMGFWYIVVPHDPINSDGAPNVLFVSTYDGGWLFTHFDIPGHHHHWSDTGAFAFLVP